MLPLPVQIQEVMVAFAHLFTCPVWHHAQILILGAILARGKRTVTSALRAMGLAQERHFTNYHRVLNRAVRHASFTAKCYSGAWLPSCLPKCRCRYLWTKPWSGAKEPRSRPKGVSRCCALIAQKGRPLLRSALGRDDAPRSSSLVPPSLGATLLYSPGDFRKDLPETGQAPQERHRSCLPWAAARAAMDSPTNFDPGWRWGLCGPRIYPVVPLPSQSVTLVARFRWNAALYDSPPAPIPGKRGRKPTKGKRQLSLNSASPIPRRFGRAYGSSGTMEQSARSCPFPAPASGTRRESLPSPSGGSWCETPRASSKTPLCSAPT